MRDERTQDLIDPGEPLNKAGATGSRPVMDVLIVSQPATDGVLRHVDLLCRYLIGQGVRLHLAYSDLQSGAELHALVKYVADHGGRTLNLRIGNAPQWADIPAGAALLRLIRDVRPQVIHAHSSKAGGLVRVLGLAGLRTPVFYTPHAYYRMHDPAHWKARIFHAAERILGRVGTSIGMGYSESDFARDVLRIPPAQRLIIPNGVNSQRYCPASVEEKRLLREKFQMPLDACLLGTVGRFSVQKDPETLYAALVKALEKAPNLIFVHLGRGELEPKVDSFLAGLPVASRLRRIPYLSNSSEFYRMLDGFVLTSRYEGLSYAAMEALACGLPAVLSDAPGNRDLAALNFSHLWQAKPGDIQSITEAILACYATARSPVKNNHREVVLERFTEELCNSRVFAAYEAVNERAATIRPSARRLEQEKGAAT